MDRRETGIYPFHEIPVNKVTLESTVVELETKGHGGTRISGRVKVVRRMITCAADYRYKYRLQVTRTT